MLINVAIRYLLFVWFDVEHILKRQNAPVVHVIVT